MYGVNQDTVSVEDIDKYKLSETQKIEHLHDIKRFPGVEEICIMSSNMRSEYYLNVDETTFKHGDLLRYLSTFTGKPLKEIILETYSKFNKDVVNHLFTVVSGMEARPKGSYTTLRHAENALNVGAQEETLGFMLKDLFKNAIKFSRKMRLSETMKPFYNTQPSRAIEMLEDTIGELNDKKYVLFGNGYDVIHLAKLLLSLNVQSLTIANEDAFISKKMINNLKDWVDLTVEGECTTRFHAADLVSVCYRFSNADGIVLLPSFDCECLTSDMLEKVETIRQTKKIQVIVDFNENNRAAFESLGHLVSYTSFNDQSFKEFSDEELSQADIYFDENLLQVTEKFMENYQLVNEKHAQDHLKELTSLNQAVGSDTIQDPIS